MKNSIKHIGFEEKARSMAEGFRGMPSTIPQVIIRGEAMAPAHAALRFQGMLDAFQSVRDADAAGRSAVDALDKAMADHQAFYEASVEVVKSHFGSDPKRLATFGLVGPKRGHRRGGRQERREVVRTTIVEEVTRGRDPNDEVIETEEVIETAEPIRGSRRPRRERTSSRPRPVATPAPAPAGPGGLPAPATPSASKARSKRKAGH